MCSSLDTPGLRFGNLFFTATLSTLAKSASPAAHKYWRAQAVHDEPLAHQMRHIPCNAIRLHKPYNMGTQGENSLDSSSFFVFHRRNRFHGQSRTALSR
jgi:hypothetical protein